MRKVFAFMLAIVLALLCACAAAEEAAEDLSLEYLRRGDGIYRLGNTGYLVEDSRSFVTEETMAGLERNAKELNEAVPLGANGIRKYIYFVENSRAVRLDEDMTSENPVYTRIRECFEADGFETLALESPQDYLNWFYQTDHHWNYKGSYKGYCDLVRLIFGEEEELAVPAETVVFDDMPYSGSYNNRLGYHKSNDLFTVYRFEGLPEYSCSINGDRSSGKYGKMEKFFKGNHQKIADNYYAQYYGGDPAELVIDTHQPDKPNLLLISNSYDNALIHLLTKHYNVICSLDTRYYESTFKKTANIPKIIQKYAINHVVMLGDILFLAKPYALH